MFDEGKCPCRYYNVLRVFSPQNTVGHDTIENIEFPSFLIYSPEVKMSVSQSIFGVWRYLRPYMQYHDITRAIRRKLVVIVVYNDLLGGIFDQRVPSD